MSGELEITVVGNISEYEMRFTPSGVAVGKFAIASTPRKRQDDKWVDGDVSWVNTTVWRGLAENCAQTLRKGVRVIAVGTFAARTFETKEGDKRTVWEFTATSVGVELTFATAQVTKTSSGGGGGQHTAGDDEWSSASKERPAQATQQPSAETQRQQQPTAPPSDGW